jgi:hypothetical protein
MVVVPMATADNIRARCEMDLSPGIRVSPVSGFAVAERRGLDAVMAAV